jgi:hypothetical protein
MFCSSIGRQVHFVIVRRRLHIVVGQRLSAMIESVKRRNVGQCLPCFGLQIDCGTDFTEVADHL